SPASSLGGGQTVSPVMETLAGVPKKKPNTPLFAGIAVVAVAIVGLVLFRGAGNTAEDPSTAATDGEDEAAAQNAAGPSPDLHDDAQAKSASIRVVGAPEGARVFFRDARVSENPFRVELSDVNQPLRVEADGYETYSVMIAPSEDREVKVEMNQAPSSA